MDEPAFVGCLVESRVIGVIEAEQTEEGKTERNDRLIGVAEESRSESEVQTLEELPENLLDEIEHFFVSYNEARGKRFEPKGRFGPRKARALIRAGSDRFRKKPVGKK